MTNVTLSISVYRVYRLLSLNQITYDYIDILSYVIVFITISSYKLLYPFTYKIIVPKNVSNI